MEMRRLGETGLAVSRIGLGLAALGRPGYLNLGHGGDIGDDTRTASMEARAHEVLDTAHTAGVSYFDAARSYGRAEEFLASWLRTRSAAANGACIASKWGYAYTADWKTDAAVHEVKEHSLVRFEHQLEETRAILGYRLGLYQVHSLTHDSPLFTDPALLTAIARLRAEGVHVGVSVTGPSQSAGIERALELEADGRRLFSTVQATWNLLETSAAPALAAAHADGAGVIVKEALANGRLTERNRDPSFAPALVRLRAEAERAGVSLDALAIAAVLARPWADVVLSGASTPKQLESNLIATNAAFDGSAEAALAEIVEAPQDYWTVRSRLVWS